MATKQYTYQIRQIASTPRNKRLTDGIQQAAQTGGSGGGYIQSSTPQYWQLVTTDADGNPLEEAQYYLQPVQGQHLLMPGDVVAYAVDPDIEDVEFPIASYTQKGILSVKSGTGLVIEDGVLSINPDLIGGGGIDTEQLAEYLTQNNYVNQQWLVDNGYLKLTSPLTGYVKPGTYSPLTAEDTLIGAIGKLEANFGNYVDLTTDQTIGGNKTFNNLIVGKDDVVCYAVGDVEDVAFPLASYTQKGILSVQQGTGLLVSNGVLSLDPDYAGGGGVNFTPGTALELTSGGTLNVKIGTTSGTVCAGNDTRLTTAYNNSHTHSNKSVLDGITSGYVSNWNTAYNLSHSHSNKSVLDGISSSDVSNWGTAYNNAHWHSNKSYLDVINQDLSNSDSPRFADLTLRTSGPTLSFYNTSDTMLYWRIIYPGTSNLEIHRQTTRVMSITGSGDLIAVGDVVAYSNSSSVSDISAVATTSTYGLVKYDGSTIGKNSSGQLYVINGGGGSSGTVYWENISGKPSWIGSSKPSYSWSEIGSKPNVLSTVSTSGSGNVVTGVSYNGSTVTVTKGNVSGGGSNVVWSATTNNTATLSVDGAAKQLPLATGFSVNEYTSYAAIKIVGYSLNVSLNGHTHSWSSITGKPSIISSISVSRSGSGNAVGSLSVSGSTIYYNMTNISTSGGGDWNGGTVTNNITISRSGATLLLQNGSYKWDFRNAGNTLYLEKNGTPHLYVMGANWTINSDERIKDIGSPVEDILDKLSSLRVVHFTYKNRLGLGKQIGVIAQDIQRVFPESVSRGAYDETVGDYILGVDYSTLGAVVAIAGLKELYTRFRPVENKVKVLESKVRNLQARLDNAYREIFNLKEGKETA